jgi:hypothetical protein
VSSTASSPVAAGQPVLTDDGPHGALLQRLRHEVMPIQALALHRKEKLARATRTRVNRVGLRHFPGIEVAGG